MATRTFYIDYVGGADTAGRLGTLSDPLKTLGRALILANGDNPKPDTLNVYLMSTYSAQMSTATDIPGLTINFYPYGAPTQTVTFTNATIYIYTEQYWYFNNINITAAGGSNCATDIRAAKAGLMMTGGTLTGGGTNAAISTNTTPNNSANFYRFKDITMVVTTSKQAMTINGGFGLIEFDNVTLNSTGNATSNQHLFNIVAAAAKPITSFVFKNNHITYDNSTNLYGLFAISGATSDLLTNLTITDNEFTLNRGIKDSGTGTVAVLNGTQSTVTDGSKSWGTLTSYYCKIGNIEYVIASNTGTVLTVTGFPPVGSQSYTIYPASIPFITELTTQQASYLTFTGNTLTTTTSCGIGFSAYGYKDVLVTDNTINTSGTLNTTALRLGTDAATGATLFSGNGVVRGNVINSSVYWGTTQYGIHGMLIGWGADNCEVYENESYGCGYGFVIKGDNTNLHHNVCDATTNSNILHGIGILLKQTQNSTIEHNVSISKGSVLNNSMAIGVCASEIVMEYATNCIVRNNIFIKYGAAGAANTTVLNYNGEGENSAVDQGNYFDYNVYYAPDGANITVGMFDGAVVTPRNTLAAIQARWNEGAAFSHGNDTHSIIGNPLLDSNYRPQSGSVALYSGYPGPCTDIGLYQVTTTYCSPTDPYPVDPNNMTTNAVLVNDIVTVHAPNYTIEDIIYQIRFTSSKIETIDPQIEFNPVGYRILEVNLSHLRVCLPIGTYEFRCMFESGGEWSWWTEWISVTVLGSSIPFTADLLGSDSTQTKAEVAEDVYSKLLERRRNLNDYVENIRDQARARAAAR